MKNGFLFWLIALFAILLSGSCSFNESADCNVIETVLDNSWEFSEAGKNEWQDAVVPGCVHTDLLRHKEIKDPFYRLNEHDVQWIDKKDWEYKTTFKVKKSLLKNDHVLLDFKGLDTYADVYLNDSLILSADNMFRGWKVECKGLLKAGDNNLSRFVGWM